MKNLDKFQGYVVLLCKEHYEYDDLFVSLRKLWAIRCGYDYEYTPSDVDKYIANDMFNIIKKISNRDDGYIVQRIHDSLVGNTYYRGELEPIQKVLLAYVDIIRFTQIKERRGNRYISLVKLPPVKKRILNKVFKNNKYHTLEVYNSLTK